MFKLISMLFLFSAVIPSHAQTPTTTGSSIIAEGATLQLISDQFSFTEGPAADKRGNIYFTDQPNNKIWKYAIDGTLSVFLENAGRSNGMYFDKKGNLITCADEHNQLWSIKPNRKVTVLLKDLNGLHFNGPNDVWVHPNGGIYFTDPYYQRDYWIRKSPEIEGQKVYYLQRDKVTVVADNLKKPNGIIGTPDGKYLYVADIEANKTYKFFINDDGTLNNQTLFVNQGSDGMTIDNKGNIYLTGKGVSIYNAEGKMIEHITVPQDWTSNVTFGGKKKNVLFITASKAIYKLKMKVKGV
jgi:gluconolactonase